MSEDLLPEQTEFSFGDLLGALRDEANPFPARYLYRLSGLEGNELDQLRKVWPLLSAQRRLGLLEDLELLAESNTVMHFDAVDQQALSDEEAEIRIVAIRSLWPSEQKDLIPVFIDLLNKDENTGVRAQAAAALGRFVYLGELGKIPTGTLKEVEEQLLDVLDADVDPIVQRRALESLGYSSRPEVADLIESVYQGGEPDWVASALFAMGRSADDRWAPIVIEHLQDTNPDLSREAARAAGELELSEALSELLDLLDDEDSEVRLAAAWSLSQIGGREAADALEGLLERSDDEDEIDLIENALENLAFTEELGELNLLDFATDDLEDLTHPEEDKNGNNEDLDAD